MNIQDLWRDILDNKEVIILLSLVWILLFEYFSPFILISGVFISILVVLFTDRFLLKGNYEHSYVIGYGTLFRYAGRLIIEIYLAGIDVIPTIIKGDADVEIVRVETKLTDELLIDILANSITLTPGTVSVEKLGNQLLVLNLNAQTPDEDRRELIPLRLEKILLDYEEKVMDFDVIIILILALYSLAGLYRALRGPTIWDRLLGSALFSSKVIIIAILIGMLIDRSFVVDVALIYAVFGFLGTIMIARFVERRGDI